MYINSLPSRFSFSAPIDEANQFNSNLSRKMSNVNPVVDSDLVRQLLSTQELLRKNTTKMEVLEIVLDTQKMSLLSKSPARSNPRNKYISMESDTSYLPTSAVESSGESSESAKIDSDATVGIISAIKSEIDYLKICVSERSLKSHPFGYLLGHSNNKVLGCYDLTKLF